MRNPATCATRDDFNSFTSHLRNAIKATRVPKVVLRNGLTVPVSWFADDGPEYEHFVFKGIIGNTQYYLIWENDGHSITSSDFDMMELA